MEISLFDTHCHPQFSQYDKDRDAVIQRALDGGIGLICVGTDLVSSQAAIVLAERYDGLYASVGLHPNNSLGNDHDHDKDITNTNTNTNNDSSTTNITNDNNNDSSTNDSSNSSTTNITNDNNNDSSTNDSSNNNTTNTNNDSSNNTNNTNNDSSNNTNNTNNDLAFEELLEHPKVVALGEIGLDYYQTKDPGLQTKQRERFVKQLESASRGSMPVIIHCRDAHDDMYKVLKDAETSGIVHSFTGTWFDAQRYLELGYYIGLNGIITFARNYDETVINMPLDRLVLETDAPYLTPIPYRGRRNEPLYVIEVAKKIAELKGISVEQVKKITTDNTLLMFRGMKR